MVSEDVFIEFLLERGFKEDIGYYYKSINDTFINCYFNRSFYSPESIINVKVYGSYGMVSDETFSEWIDFKSYIVSLMRDIRLKKILG